MAILKCHVFLSGLQHFQVITDHNPLIPILNNHRLDEIENPRLQQLRTRVMGYNFTAQWLKGSNNNPPDALSRNSVSDPTPQMHLLNWIHLINQTYPFLKEGPVLLYTIPAPTWIHYTTLLMKMLNTNN